MDNNAGISARIPDAEPTPIHLDDSVGWMAVEELLEEALRGIHAQDPAHYISTMMPSRQAARASWGYSIANTQPSMPSAQRQFGRSVSRPGGVGRRHTSSAGRRPVRPTVRLRNRTDCRDSLAFDVIQGVVEDIIVEEEDEEDENEGRDETKILSSIKSMAAPMAVKRSERDRLVKNKKRKLDSSFAWRTSLQKHCNHVTERARGVFNAGFIWQNAIRKIEGHYGTSVAAVFVFIQWLFLVNVLVFVVVAMFIVVPEIIYSDAHYKSPNATSIDEILLEIATNCSVGNSSIDVAINKLRQEIASNSSADSGIGLLQDFIQGTGWMRWTEMYYGNYKFDSDDDFAYNLPFAYVLATMIYFGLCLILMLRNTAKGSRENLFTTKGRVNECCNIVFGSWDYCVSDQKKAGLRHEIIYNEIKVIIEEDKLLELKKSRTEKDRIILYLLRVFINSFVICLLLLCGYLIYFVVYKSRELLSQNKYGDFGRLTIEFLPSMAITILNIFVPFAFYRLVTYERYAPGFVINITLVRTVFLKMASFAVLSTTLYYGVIRNEQCVACWETYVGQQIYKLAIMDFATGFFITFFVHFPRMLLVTRTSYTFTKFIGRQQFDIPNHVLDIVYSQTLCWMGTFYSPLLPVLNIVKCFVFFYVKEFSLFINCEPSRVTYRASKSNTLFTIVLLLSFILAIVPVAYSIGALKPSDICGPFIRRKIMWDVVPDAISKWPESVKHFVHYFGTAGFAIPVIILLLLIIYFYITMSSAHKNEIQLLQEQLLMEGRDKQYLLNRLRHVLAYRQSYVAPS